MEPVSNERAEKLHSITPKVNGESLTTVKELTVQAIRLMERSSKNDKYLSSVLARLFAYDVDLHGEGDLQRATHRAQIDGYLASRREMPRTSFRNLRADLYGLGRHMHPTEFPEPNRRSEDPLCTPPAEPATVRLLYSRAVMAGGIHQVRAETVLDLAHGVGARTAEILPMRGRQVSTTSWLGRTVTVVQLSRKRADDSTIERTVPVMDQEVAARLRHRAAQAGADGFMVPRRGEGFGIDRIKDQIQRRINSDYPLNVESLRNAYVKTMASRVPAALLMQLADLSRSSTLMDLSREFEPIGLSDAIEHMIRGGL